MKAFIFVKEILYFKIKTVNFNKEILYFDKKTNRVMIKFRNTHKY